MLKLLKKLSSSIRNFKKQNPELCAVFRVVKLKKERDDSWAEMLLLLEQKPQAQLIHFFPSLHKISIMILLNLL